MLGEGGDLAFKKGIFWCHRGGDLHPNVEALRQRLGGNFKLCEIDGFDELFADLDKNSGAPAEKPGRHRRPGNSRDFDDRPMEGATLADLDLDLALRTAHEYSRKLGLREPCSCDIEAFPAGAWSTGR